MIKNIDSVKTKNKTYASDIVVSSADYHHTDQDLLGSKSNYTSSYWDKREMAPSSLLFYVGVIKSLKTLGIIICFLMKVLKSILKKFILTLNGLLRLFFMFVHHP